MTIPFNLRKDSLYPHQFSMLRELPTVNDTEALQSRFAALVETRPENRVDYTRDRRTSNEPKRRTQPDGAPRRYRRVQRQGVKQRSVSGRSIRSRNQKCILASPTTVQCTRKDNVRNGSPAGTESLPYQKLPLPVPDQSNRDLLSDSSVDLLIPPLPPPPSDVEALHWTWEQVRLCPRNRSKISSLGDNTASDMTTFTGALSEKEVLTPRGGRIELKDQPRIRKVWEDQRSLVRDALEKDISIRDNLERASIWLQEEDDHEGLQIDAEIKRLEKHANEIEAEWSSGLWQAFFFKRPNAIQAHILGRWLERRQLHVLLQGKAFEQLGSRDSDPKKEGQAQPLVNFYPPVIPWQNHRPSVDTSQTPYDLNPDRLRNGYVFSDVSYAVSIMPHEFNPKELDILRKLPTCRLYKNLDHYLEGLKIEVKPQGWGSSDVKVAVRYLTLTGMTMLHEYLKLCFMSSNDETFVPLPQPFHIHLIAAVGSDAWHYIHRIKGDLALDNLGYPLRYESGFLRKYDLKRGDERNDFRKTLNEIHVLQISVYRDIISRKFQDVLALEEGVILQRLQERTHEGIRFSLDERNEVRGYRVESNSSNPRTFFAPATEKTIISDPVDIPKPRSVTSDPAEVADLRSTTPDPAKITKLQAPQNYAAVQHKLQALCARDGRPRCQAWLKKQRRQCSNTARKDRLSCGMPAHRQALNE